MEQSLSQQPSLYSVDILFGCLIYMSCHASSVSVKSRCFSWSLSPRCININDPYSVAHKRVRKRGCLHGVGGPQVGEVTRLSGVKKNNRRLYAILQPRHLKKATCFGG